MSFLKSRTPLSAQRAFMVLSVILFLFSIQVSLSLYVDSSYLKSAIQSTPSLANTKIWAEPDHVIGVLYALASLVTIIGLMIAPNILRKFGNYRWTLGILIVHALLLLGLALSNSAWLIIPLFILEATLISILYFNFDIFLEKYSKDGKTGIIRGIVLAITSIAWIVPPFAAGIIVDRYGFYLVYLVAALFVIPMIFLMMRYFSHFHDMHYDAPPIIFGHEKIRKRPDISRILWVQFLLQVFFALLVIYAPLYFHDQLGFTFEEIGIITSVSLAAFVLLPAPQGWLADKILGEKEMLLVGFLLMGLMCFAIPYLGSHSLSLVLWAGVLFVGRAGAATVETMAQVYFFKKIDGHNASHIGHFRRMRPLAYLVTPLVASVLLELNIIVLSQLFYLMGFVMLLALYLPLKIKDTK